MLLKERPAFKAGREPLFMLNELKRATVLLKRARTTLSVPKAREYWVAHVRKILSETTRELALSDLSASERSPSLFVLKKYGRY